MANVQHKDLTGSDLHEIKGAASASAGTVPISDGGGSAPFGFYNYNNLTNRPIVPVVQNNGVAVTSPRISTFTGVASSGLWSIAISGFTTVHSVVATCLSSGTTIGTSAVACVASITPTVISGSVVVLGTPDNTLGTNQPIFITVFGS